MAECPHPFPWSALSEVLVQTVVRVTAISATQAVWEVTLPMVSDGSDPVELQIAGQAATTPVMLDPLHLQVDYPGPIAPGDTWSIFAAELSLTPPPVDPEFGAVI